MAIVLTALSRSHHTCQYEARLALLEFTLTCRPETNQALVLKPVPGPLKVVLGTRANFY